MADANHAHAPAAQQTVILERLARLLAVAGRDAALHHRLCQSPKAVLAEAGLAVADGVQVTTISRIPPMPRRLPRRPHRIIWSCPSRHLPARMR